MDVTNILSLFFIGTIYYLLYKWLKKDSRFSRYIPGGDSEYYTIHKKIDVKFEDIYGCDEIKKEIKEELDKFQKGDVQSKGLIFIGEPGNGKTMTAKAISNYTNIPFYEIYSDTISYGTDIGDNIYRRSKINY